MQDWVLVAEAVVLALIQELKQGALYDFVLQQHPLVCLVQSHLEAEVLWLDWVLTVVGEELTVVGEELVSQLRRHWVLMRFSDLCHL